MLRCIRLLAVAACSSLLLLLLLPHKIFMRQQQGDDVKVLGERCLTSYCSTNVRILLVRMWLEPVGSRLGFLTAGDGVGVGLFHRADLLFEREMCHQALVTSIA